MNSNFGSFDSNGNPVDFGTPEHRPARRNNFINRLQNVCKDQAATSREAEEEINHFLSYLSSSKFSRDTTVQVSDVLHFLMPLRNRVSAIAQELEQP